MWEPRPLATLGASTASNRDIFTFFTAVNVKITAIWFVTPCSSVHMNIRLGGMRRFLLHDGGAACSYQMPWRHNQEVHNIPRRENIQSNFV
jgi:hypothetical protein